VGIKSILGGGDIGKTYLKEALKEKTGETGKKMKIRAERMLPQRPPAKAISMEYTGTRMVKNTPKKFGGKKLVGGSYISIGASPNTTEGRLVHHSKMN